MGVTAPLAPRLTFPAIGEAGCGFMFTDAARGDDTGHGAFTLVSSVIDASVAPRFLHLERQWDALVQRALT